MSGKRPRTARRELERDLKKLVRDKERLFRLEAGGSEERPLEVSSAAVIEVRALAMPCVQCDTAQYRIREHVSIAAGLRRVDVICRNCGAPRSLWFRIVQDEPN